MEFREVFQPIVDFIRGLQKKENENSKVAAKERLKLVLMQDRASVSPDFFEMMKKEIIDVIKKYIEIDEEALEVQLTRGFEGGLEGPALYANIPIKNIKPVAKKVEEEKKQEINEGTQMKIEEDKDENISSEDIPEKQILEENGEVTEVINEEIIENVEEEKMGTSKEEIINEEKVEENKETKAEKTTQAAKPKKTTSKKSSTKAKSKK